MSPDLLLRTGALCLALASAETLHGIARTVWLVPRIGKAAAQRVGVVTGTLLALALCAAFVPGMGLQGAGQHLALGLALSAFMAGFDMALGRWLLRKSWPKVLADFNPAQGHYLLLGLCALALGPWLLGLLRA